MPWRIPASGRVPVSGRVPATGRVLETGRISDRDPALLPGLLMWLDGTRGISVNAGNVSSWADMSGNENHATQSTPGNQPSYSATGFNGFPCVDWGAGAANRGLVTPSMSLGVNTLVGVIQASASSGYWLVHNGDGVDGAYMYCLSGASYSLARAGVRSSKNVSATWLADGVQRSVAVAYNGTHATHLSYRNGILNTTSTLLGNDPGTSEQAGNVFIGMNQAGGGQYRGKMAELLAYNRALTAGEVSFLENYFRAKWGY